MAEALLRELAAAGSGSCAPALCIWMCLRRKAGLNKALKMRRVLRTLLSAENRVLVSGP